MNFKIVKNIKECERLWNKFSPNENLWDLWGINYSFYDEKRYEFFFIVSIEKNEEKGLLPLWFDKDEKEYVFCGGEFPENRKFWFDISEFEEFMKQIPGKISLYYINFQEIKRVNNFNEKLSKKFNTEDRRYFINLKKINYSLENYLKTFNKKHRKNLRYDLKQIEKINPKIIFEEDQHFDDFVKFSVNRFSKDSDFYDEEFTKQIKNFVSYLKSEKMLHTISIEVDGKIVGVELAAFYNKFYYVLNGAFDINFKNLGKLLIMSHIKNAINLNADEIDFLSDQGGWKELWNLKKEDYYDFES